MQSFQLDATKVEVLKTLYPIFKKEVYERREQMTRISRFGMGLFLGMMILILVVPVEMGSNPVKFFSSSGTAILAGLLVFQMWQHRKRHIMAKYAVIEIEKALFLFEPDIYLPGKGLYPDEWKQYQGGEQEWFLTSFLLVVVSSLSILAIWFA